MFYVERNLTKFTKLIIYLIHRTQNLYHDPMKNKCVFMKLLNALGISLISSPCICSWLGAKEKINYIYETKISCRWTWSSAWRWGISWGNCVKLFWISCDLLQNSHLVRSWRATTYKTLIITGHLFHFLCIGSNCFWDHGGEKKGCPWITLSDQTTPNSSRTP